MKKKDKIVLGIGLFAMALIIVIGTSYAYWKLSKVQEDRNIIATGCFNVEFTDGDGINLQSAYPISDEDGLKLTPYTFTIENKCDSYVSYQINLETLEQETGVKVLPDQYVRAALQEGEENKANSTLISDIETEKTLTEATKAYKLYEKFLKPNQSKTYNLRIWMDKDTQPIEETMNAFYSGKIAIDFSYISEKPKVEIEGTLRASTGSKDTTAFYNYKSNITNIIIQDEISLIETELSWDVSEDNSGKVMSYLVPNEDDNTKYTLYLQGDGGIYANADSSSLFNGFTNLTTIEGLEYLDTSKVTLMPGMFSGCGSLTSLDVSSFDTSNVTNMAAMFSSCSSLTELDLSNFDTSNVTIMGNMFINCRNLTSLDLSNFDTSKVINMQAVFSGCTNLESIGSKPFDMVVPYGGYSYGLFSGCAKINCIVNLKMKEAEPHQYDFGLLYTNAATDTNAKIVLNYTKDYLNAVSYTIANNRSSSKIVKGDLIPSHSIEINNENVIYKGDGFNNQEKFDLYSNDDNKIVKSFKMNGEVISGNSFIMSDRDVSITDVELVTGAIAESEHNPYLTSITNKVYYEKTFEGATSLTVTIDYETYSTNYSWIYLYGKGSETPYEDKKFGGTANTETITIPGDYLKITMTNTNDPRFYGFKATIIPNY